MADLDSMHARHHDAIASEGAGWMAAAGAAIGFALHEIADAEWNIALLLVGVAILLWCGSFAAGIFRQAIHTATLQASMLHAAFIASGATAADAKPLRSEHERRAEEQVRWRRWQLWLLFCGALIYLVATVCAAWERSHGAAAIRCRQIEARMFSGKPPRPDLPPLFQALHCQPQE